MCQGGNKRNLRKTRADRGPRAGDSGTASTVLISEYGIRVRDRGIGPSVSTAGPRGAAMGCPGVSRRIPQHRFAPFRAATLVGVMPAAPVQFGVDFWLPIPYHRIDRMV